MGDAPNLSTAELAEFISRVAAMSPADDDAECIDRISKLESLKSVISAAQAKEAVRFDCLQRRAQAAAGTPVEQLGRGVGQQVALARRVSPWQGQRWLGWAKVVVAELPATFAELAAGRTTEWRTMLVARETAVLSRADRATVDRELASRLQQWGDKRVEVETRKAAYRLDPAAAVARAGKAEGDRRVSLRPAPDTMCWLSALLPVAQGVAVYGALFNAANSCTAGGDERGRGQIMADTLVERVTGLATADGVGVEIVLVMPAESLLGDPGAADVESTDVESADVESADVEPADVEPADVESADVEPVDIIPVAASCHGADEPATVLGYGPVPAGWGRQIAFGRSETSPAGPRWIRRLYTRRGRPVELESTRRLFTPGQQRFLRLRDETCRTPWCDAPIRHADHIDPHDFGGPTHTDNGQGLCAACNFAKQAPGWVNIVRADGVITTRTPTGHEYDSPAPAIVGQRTTGAGPPHAAAA